MRLSLSTWNPFEKLMIATGFYPTPMLYGFWGMAASRVLMAGVELGVFDALASGPLTAEELAARIGCDEIGTEALANALNGFGYLKRRHGRYTNARVVRRWLQADSRFPLDRAFGLFRVLWTELTDIEERLRSADRRDFHAQRDARFWADYENGLAQFARLAAPEIVRKVRLGREPESLLDIGGGHGTYTMRFCKTYPSLRAEIIDLPGAAAIGRGFLAAEGLEERVTYREADLTTADWGRDHDVILLFNVVHVFEPAQIATLFAKAKAALRPGGTFVVLDSAHKGGTGNIDTTGGANELLFYVINNTRAYPEASVGEWMRAAGFRDVKVNHLLVVPQAALTTGVA